MLCYENKFIHLNHIRPFSDADVASCVVNHIPQNNTEASKTAGMLKH